MAAPFINPGNSPVDNQALIDVITALILEFQSQNFSSYISFLAGLMTAMAFVVAASRKW